MSTETTGSLPLAGIRIVDVSRALSGPFCSMLLGDLGADVIKVETHKGDMSRVWEPQHEGVSLFHLSANRNKRSIALDTNRPAGIEVLRAMVQNSEVVLENFRPGVLRRLGLDPEWLTNSAPDVIIASVRGYGTQEPASTYPAFDQIAQGMSGLMSLTGQPNDTYRVGIPIADITSAMFTALGVVSALLGRARGHAHRTVETSLLESMLGILTFQAQKYITTGSIPEPAGNAHPTIAPYGTYRTADRNLNIAAGTQEQFERLCAVLEIKETAQEPRFANGSSRLQNRALLTGLIEAKLRRRPSTEWLALLREADIPAGPVHNLAEAMRDPFVEATGMVEVHPHPRLGDTPTLRGPIHLDGRPTPIRAIAPELGQHSHELLREFGYDGRAIAAMEEAGIIRQSPAVDNRLP